MAAVSKIITCEVCGATIRSTSGSQKYCPECAKKVRNERAKQRKRMRSNIPAQLTCKRCGKPIEGSAHHKYCTDCGAAARKEHILVWKMKRSGKLPQTATFCTRCGRLIEHPVGGQKYCSEECRREAKKEMQAKYRAEAKEKTARGSWHSSYGGPKMTNSRPQEIKERAESRASKSDSQLRKLASIADWAGISYGRLMAMPEHKRMALEQEYSKQQEEENHETS